MFIFIMEQINFLRVFNALIQISNQLQVNSKNRKSLAYLISHTEILVCFEFADQFMFTKICSVR